MRRTPPTRRTETRNSWLVASSLPLVGAAALTLVVASLTSAACKSGGDETGAGGQGGAGEQEYTAREYFVQFVDPELSVTCGNCHQFTANCTPQFMGADPDTTYDLLRAHPGLVTHADNSNLVYHGAHTGPALSTNQEKLVREWLALEFPGAPEGKTLDDALTEFGQCMTLEDFELYAVYELAYAQTADGPCGSCHRTGEAGTFIGYNVDEMYAKNKIVPWIKRLIEPVYDGDNHFVDLEASDRFRKKVEEANQCGSTHPGALLDAQLKANIQAYVEATHARWTSGACDAQ